MIALLPVFLAELGLNGLPYRIPIHPNLVHLTLGLFIVAIAFDIVGALYPLEKPVFKFLAITATRSSLFDVGWYNLVGAAIVTFFTVAAGFYEMLMASGIPEDKTSAWGLHAMETMIWHGLGGVVLLALIVGMTVWRGFQRYVWRQDRALQIQWTYLIAGLGLFALMFVQGTLGAHLGGEFGLHVTADQMLRSGLDPNTL